jgi:hypothetical protein
VAYLIFEVEGGRERGFCGKSVPYLFNWFGAVKRLTSDLEQYTVVVRSVPVLDMPATKCDVRVYGSSKRDVDGGGELLLGVDSTLRPTRSSDCAIVKDGPFRCQRVTDEIESPGTRPVSMTS